MAKRGERKYSFDDIKRIAMSCSDIKEFRYRYDKEYDYAWRYGWLTQLYPDYKPRHYYSDEEVIAAAKKYVYYGDFYKYNKAEYMVAWNRGLLETFTWLKHREHCVDGSPFDNVYVYEFPSTNTVYIGRTTRPKLRIYEHTQKDDPVRIYADSIGVEVPKPVFLFTNCSIYEGAAIEVELMNWYSSIGVNLINSVKGGGLGALAAGKWTKAKCIEYAKKFTYWRDLDHAYPNVAQKIRNNGWKNECTWLKYLKALPGKFSRMSENEASMIASQYSTVQEFKRDYLTLYQYAAKRKWLCKWFPGMKGPRSVYAFDNNGMFVKSFASIKEAGDFVNRNPASISGVCRGKKRTCGGYRWFYVEDNPFFAKYDPSYVEEVIDSPEQYLEPTGT